MQIKIEKGRGYVPGNVRAFADVHSKKIGHIMLDASFSPIRRVSYAVESARVEQRTDLDKVVMHIDTNGVISPEEAVRQSAAILIEQLSVFAALQNTEDPADAQTQRVNAPQFDPSCCAQWMSLDGRFVLPTV